MKKAITIFFLISYLLSTPSLITHKSSVNASPVTLTADPIAIIVPDNYKTIQGAINNASSGATIFVRKGTYHEHVVINKTITLVGEDSDLTIIDGNKTNNVVFVRAKNVIIKNFTVTQSGMYPYSGILMDHSMGCIISNNKIINNYEGINVLYSSSNVICGNTLLNNYDGIYLYPLGNNVISGNTVVSNKYDGMFFYSSSNNVISGNALLYNNNFGIDLASSSSNNTIYHNNFNNTNQARSEWENIWNYGNEGNYWSNYTGQDINQDGIGDDPYVIDAVNKDDYPLMGVFYEFNITLEGEAYNITIVSNSTISVFMFQIGAETGNKIIRFNTTAKDGTLGFCRVKIPTALMNYPYIVLVDSEEIIPTVLNVSNEAYAYLYFTYHNENNAIAIISSKTLALYFELLDGYVKLQKDLYDLNKTYYALLGNYSILLSNYTQLLSGLNTAYHELLDNYNDLNKTLNALSGNYSQLQSSFHDLNDSYQEHLLDYSEQMQNIRNLTYILAALAAILIITTIYLSKREHTNVTTRIKTEEENKC